MEEKVADRGGGTIVDNGGSVAGNGPLRLLFNKRVGSLWSSILQVTVIVNLVN